MSRRPRILAAQAVVVALLVLVVYMTLLRPDSSEPLRGISAPGPDQRTEAPSGERDSRLDRRRDRRRDGRRRESPGGGTRTPADADRVGVAPGITASTGDPPTAGPVTPLADQYADAVAALLGKVAGAAPTGAE